MLLQKKNYFNLRPAVIVTAGFVMGILIGFVSVKVSNWMSFALFLFLALSLGFISIFCFYKNKKFYGVVFATAFAVLVLGIILISSDLIGGYNKVGYSDFSGTIYEIESESLLNGKYYYSLIVKGNFLGNENALCYINLNSVERLFFGSKLSFMADFSLYSEPYDYDVFYYANDVSLIKSGDLYGLIPILRNKLLLSLQTHAGENYGLTYALLTGDTAYVLLSALQKYQKIGVAHLFAVSGLHIGLMYGVLYYISKLIKIKGWYRLVTVLFILFCYVGFCGFSPSSMRAFIIVSVREIAFLTGRKPDGTSNLSISAFIVLIINPTDLFSVSFLLSFSVYLGLLLLASPLSNFLSKYLPKILSKLMATSLVASLISTPILVDVFGYASIFSFMFNMVLIPFISLLYPFILFCSILLAIFNVPAFSFLSIFTFNLIDFLLGKANLDLFLINGVTFGATSVFYYLFLYSFANKFNLSRKTYRILRIIILVIFIISFILINCFYY